MFNFHKAFFILALLQVNVANAEEKIAPVDPLSASNIMNMLMGLGLVLAIIFFMAWIVRRMGGMQVMGTQKIKLLGGMSLGAREKVVLVQIENKRLVLGVAQGQVNTLHVMDGEFETDEKESVDSAAPFKEKFLHALSQTINNKTAKK